MTDYIVDNSAWARFAAGDPGVVVALRRIERAPADLIVTCPPQVLEICHSARTPAEHDVLRETLDLFFPVEHHPGEPEVLALQSALWKAGMVRAAGPRDLHIAAYALANRATVLTCDHDFEHIAAVSELDVEYIAPHDQSRT